MGSLPDFPWDLLAPYAEKARAHPDGIVDLSVGTPVDATPEVVQRALTEAADAPGYPLTAGSPALREAIATWFERRFGAELDPAAVLPVIGTKELVAWLPTLLGRGLGRLSRRSPIRRTTWVPESPVLRAPPPTPRWRRP